MVYSNINNDKLKDYVDVLSMQGFKYDKKSNVFVRKETFYFVGKGDDAKRIAVKINDKPLCHMRADKDYDEARSHTNVAMLEANYKGNTAKVVNEYQRVKTIFDTHDKFLLNLLAMAPEMTDDKSIQQIKNLPEHLHGKLFDTNNNILEEASLKDINKELQVLNKNPYYKDMVNDCLNHNYKALKVIKGLDLFSQKDNENNNEMILTTKKY